MDVLVLLACWGYVCNVIVATGDGSKVKLITSIVYMKMVCFDSPLHLLQVL